MDKNVYVLMGGQDSERVLTAASSPAKIRDAVIFALRKGDMTYGPDGISKSDMVRSFRYDWRRKVGFPTLNLRLQNGMIYRFREGKV